MVEHVDPEALALTALGEPLSDTDREHLALCAACSDEVATLTAAVAVGRSATAADSLVTPPLAVWERIRAELDLTPGLLPDGGSTGPHLAEVPTTDPATVEATPGRHRAPGPDDLSTGAGSAPSSAPEVDGAPGGLAPVVPLRRRRGPWVASAAAAGLVLGGVGGAWWAGQDDPDTSQVLASTTLDPLPGWAATGEATVVEAADGTRELVLSLEGGEDLEGYREVWLIDREVTRLVSLGVLEGAEGRFSIPTDLDLADFAVVDVSDEPYDGDPAHSGDSIIRGILDA
ncbi:anti-sigma factor [Actinotalea sp. K2]|uniref:anti-sigma factor n=1 Tax=Actinotalea sp. K2 TaxID=2939438 RepID=UPI0020180DD0|nr:anti-sigma factor [Actinotalea sp. K2]MCL3861669.1 anti-sigma factor [Actinotalea sp. K2]